MDTISEKYKKYLIELKLDGENKFLVSGMDISRDFEDFVLVDRYGKILLFNDFLQIKEFVKNNKIQDCENFQCWIKELKSKKPYYSLDVDCVINTIRQSHSFAELSLGILNNTVDLINIIGDYAYQINSEELIFLYENEQINHFKETFMDAYIWKTNENNKTTLYTVEWDIFKAEFKMLIDFFKLHFNYVN